MLEAGRSTNASSRLWNAACTSSPSRGPVRAAQAKLGERWRRGVFLGVDRTTSEYLLWDEGAVVPARAIQRLRAPLRWPQEEYNKIDSGPSGLYAAAEPERIENAGPAPALPGGELERPVRGFQIRMADWLEHGSTPGCQKCNTARDLGWSFAGGPHSKACVERYRALFSSSEAGRLRLERAAQRLGAREPAAAAQEELMRPLVLKPPEVIRSDAAASSTSPRNLTTPNAREAAPVHDREDDDERMRDMEPTDGEDEEDQDMGVHEVQCEVAYIAKIIN